MKASSPLGEMKQGCRSDILEDVVLTFVEGVGENLYERHKAAEVKAAQFKLS